MRPRLAALVLALAVLSQAPAIARAAESRPAFDRAATSRASAAETAALARALADPALQRVGRVSQIDDRFALPTFVWAQRSSARASRTAGAAAAGVPTGRAAVAAAAREHLGRVAPLYRLEGADVREASLRNVHDTGRGGIVATFEQVIDGVEVYRDAMRVLMDRERRLVAVSGYLPRRAQLPAGAGRAFRLSAAQATALALEDFTGLAVGPGLVRPAGARGRYDSFALAAAIPGLELSQPLRAKRVWYHLPGALVPGYYVEVIGGERAYAYVIAARDGEVLFRHDLIVSDSYTYRVWADGAPPHLPWDGPPGIGPTPHPTGTPDLYNPPFVAPVLVTLQNGPISTNDPWLPPAATVTTGNNVDAYADFNSPDGFTAGDLRAATTSANTFDRVYDTSLAPNSSAAQRMASVTQLFYTNNFLHDWFYDSGFDEASGNAQALNFGRGGIEGDRLLAEGQDYSGINNANMLTPADGGSPRMQMYVFNRPIGNVTVNTPAPIAGPNLAGTANFGPQTFSVSGTLVMAVDGAGPTGDACSALVNAVAGKIVLIDRGACGVVTPVLNAQAAGAIGVVIVDSFDYGTPPTLSGAGSVTIPVLTLTQDAGNAIKPHLAGGVTITMSRAASVSRDGTIDNMIIAHEWGHYISNRLIGDGGGLHNLQSGGMGEGWSDFHALLLIARAGDNFDGAYPLGPYALTNSTGAMNAYYFGIRRYPYSTDMSKNPLTFQHIQEGTPLPMGPPVAFTAEGPGNSAVHRTGEVWCTMLWECYAALLNDSGRLPFTEAQQRMRDYLVAAYKMTPVSPTFTEARDALLAAAAASDPADLAAFWTAFAKRGIGTGAVAPDRYSFDQIPVVESYAVGADLEVADAEFRPTQYVCDADAYVDNGEVGELELTVRNIGAASLGSTTATVTSTNPGVSFPNGNTVALSSTAPFTSTSTVLRVRVSGAAPAGILDFQIDVDDPALLVAGPRTLSVFEYGHADEGTSATTEGFETGTDPWTYSGSSGESIGWYRRSFGSGDRRMHANDPGTTSDVAAMSPPLTIGAVGNFRLLFDHAYRMESTFDGGVIEISTDGGASWTDIGPMITSGGYTGTLVAGSALSGRPAWTGASPGYPALSPVVVDLGATYAGQTVRVRFRMASDGGVGDAGWSVASLTVENNSASVFPTIVGEVSACGPLAVDDPGLPGAIAFGLAGSNPVTGPARLRFALPAETRVELAVFDVTGRRVALLADGIYAAGEHALTWQPFAAGARRVAGVLFARLTAGGERRVQRLVVLP